MATSPGKKSGAGRRPATRGERANYEPADPDFERKLAALPRARLRALLGITPAAPEKSTPKLSHALEAIEAEDAHEALSALRASREAFDEPKEGQDPMKPVVEFDPALAAAIRANSSYRQKPFRHSIDVAIRWLEDVHGADDTAIEQEPAAEREPEQPSA